MPQLSWWQKEALIWIPDVIGSICFLISGYLALVEVSHRAWSWQPHQLSWWIVMINLLGCIAFMVAAVFGYFAPGGGEAEWSWGANFYTLLGALCFFIASYLMIPEQAGAGRSIDIPSGPDAAKAA
jgi:small-conductance mechanosensitive channel